MAKDSPITGPFPDGDSRNITLTQSDHPMEPERSGPAEPRYREDDAPNTVMGDLVATEMTNADKRENAGDDTDR